jgi:hypothetical protein
MEHTIEAEATVRARLDDVCDALARRTTRSDHPSRLHVELGSTAVGQQVDVVFGPVDIQNGSLTQSIHIEAADHRHLFPTLDGDLFALETDVPEATRICLTGRYQPPLGPAGAIGHRLAGRRLAEASIQAFFDELVSGITRELETMQVGWKPASTAWTLRDQD